MVGEGVVGCWKGVCVCGEVVFGGGVGGEGGVGNWDVDGCVVLEIVFDFGGEVVVVYLDNLWE